MYSAANQIWLFEPQNDYYFIKSGANSSLVLAGFDEGKAVRVIVDEFDPDNVKQQWRFK